ncbi:MAG: hypothetical protein GYA51_07240 [Candidatus Methanofastidiosa archaeon]|jgi:uncharacterized RDD family membrane protein YckC|nr:hypothetical protein [Candidatus Methanofastidiosa archaeon]
MKYCANCGNKKDDEIKACEKCGYIFDENSWLSHEKIGFKKRMFAYLIDIISLGIITGFLLVLIGVSPDRFTFDFYSIVFQLTYFSFSEGFFGTSLGKKILHIRVIGKEGQMPPGFEKAMLRNIFKIINPLCMGFVAIADDEEKRGWHDRIARTYVVSEK